MIKGSFPEMLAEKAQKGLRHQVHASRSSDFYAPIPIEPPEKVLKKSKQK